MCVCVSGFSGESELDFIKFAASNFVSSCRFSPSCRMNLLSMFCFLGQIFKAHKLILAACSQNFAELFETAQQSSNGSTCVILEATSADNMQALLEFMYKGEVHVSQTALESFLKAAESLQVIFSFLSFAV